MNKKGSTLVWALLVWLIIATLIFAVGSTVLSYHKRTVDNVEKNQVYLTAKSAVDIVSKEIRNKTDIGKDMLAYLGLKTGNTFFIPEFNFTQNMGKCNLTASLVNDSVIKLTAIATKNNEKETVTQYLNGVILPTLDVIFPDIVPPDNANSYHWYDWPTPETGLTPLTYENLTLVDTTYYIGNENARDSYYYVDTDTNFIDSTFDDKILKARGTGNIYIFVKKGAEFHIGGVEYSDDLVSEDGTPKNKGTVFVILEDESKMYLNNRNSKIDSYIYVYSPFEKSVVYIVGSQNAKVYGSIMAKAMKPSKPAVSNRGEYIVPENDVYLAPDYDTNLAQRKWEIVKYENK